MECAPTEQQQNKNNMENRLVAARGRGEGRQDGRRWAWALTPSQKTDE